MKTKMKSFFALAIVACGLLSSCSYDNFEEPKSQLTGRVVFEGDPVGVKRNGPRLRVIQEGYALSSPMDIFIDQDGSFSAIVADGTYKLYRSGDAPWLPQVTDTIKVTVSGNTIQDVPVTPYFTASNVSYALSNGVITTNYTVKKGVATANLDAVKIYLSKTYILDQSKYEHAETINLSTVVIDANNTATVTIPEKLRNSGVVYVRVGVKSTSSAEYSYSAVEKLEL